MELDIKSRLADFFLGKEITGTVEYVLPEDRTYVVSTDTGLVQAYVPRVPYFSTPIPHIPPTEEEAFRRGQVVSFRTHQVKPWENQNLTY